MVPYRTEPPFSFSHGFIRLPPLFPIHRLSPSLHSGPSRLYRMQEGKKQNRKQHIAVIGCRHWIQEEERSLSSLSLCIHWMSSKDPPGVLFRGGSDWLSLSRPPSLSLSLRRGLLSISLFLSLSLSIYLSMTWLPHGSHPSYGADVVSPGCQLDMEGVNNCDCARFG